MLLHPYWRSDLTLPASCVSAVVTAPPLETAEIRHVEVLQLQPRMVMVVVIAAAGANREAERSLPARDPRQDHETGQRDSGDN